MKSFIILLACSCVHAATLDLSGVDTTEGFHRIVESYSEAHPDNLPYQDLISIKLPQCYKPIYELLTSLIVPGLSCTDAIELIKKQKDTLKHFCGDLEEPHIKRSYKADIVELLVAEGLRLKEFSLRCSIIRQTLASYANPYERSSDLTSCWKDAQLFVYYAPFEIDDLMPPHIQQIYFLRCLSAIIESLKNIGLSEPKETTEKKTFKDTIKIKDITPQKTFWLFKKMVEMFTTVTYEK